MGYGRVGHSKLTPLLGVPPSGARAAQVESMLNIRMAEPLKYHAGTSVEWCGNRILATIGADVIPPAKQQRALAGLTKLQTNRMTVEEADSLTAQLIRT